MTKETKSERTARVAAELTMYYEEQRVTYPQRLMALLQRAQAANFEVRVKDMAFLLHDRDDSFNKATLDLTYGSDTDEELRRIERAVEWKEELEVEANRKFLARRVALAKLTEEEKELLELK